MSLVSTTLKKLETARTDADCHRISVELMRYATPGEIKALAEAFVTECPFRTWLVNLHANITRHRSVPASFGCRHFSPGICLYSNGAAQILEVAFCGNRGLLLGPTAVFLQYFLEESFDILVLRDPEQKGFATGIDGYAESFSRLVERLRADFHMDSYEDIRCFGCSGGGAAALAAGVMLQASKMVSFSGQPPSSASTGGTAAATDLEDHMRTAVGSAGKAFAVFGANNAHDVHGAEGLAKLMELELVPIRDVTDHSVVGALHRQGALAATLQMVGLL